MQHTLQEFIRALRAADVRVSPAEAIDAARACAVVGYADRELFKDALCVSLAKSPDEVERFDQTFETFFTRDRLSTTPPEDAERPDQDADQTPQSDAAAEGSPLAQMLLAGDAAGLAQAMEEAAQRAGVAEIRLSTQRSRMTRRLLDEMGLAEIEQIIAAARRQAEGRALAERLDARRKALVAEAQSFVERQHSLYAAGSARALREEMLAKKALNADGGIDPVDLAMMQALVKRMDKRLADRYSRRRHMANRGHLDVRKTLRKSMAHGGVPFEIEWKIKKIDKPSIVAICDVSKSVAAAAQFLLTFLYSLNEVVERLDAFAFS
ncbi:MAG: dehydrogenase/GMP reductase:VWA containing CoxE-like protein, partial [Phenylobacterium sp.]|nr:dehydrogenase/GMP reductase:VWA containing CoxE-like protein [Phenylobacterium sp.]